MAGWVLAYFLAFLVAALTFHRLRPRWWRAGALSLAGLAIVGLGSRFGEIPLPLGTVGDWWPVFALPLAYWVPAPLTGVPNRTLECRLMAIDRRLGRAVTPGGRPGLVDHLLEGAYLTVYPMVPLGLVAVLASAGSARADAFWQTVLVSVLPCYALLPLLPTRPPRALEASGHAATDGAVLRAANLRFMDVFSNHWNTIPSAHASGAVAVGVEAVRAGSPLAPVLVLLAVGISVATVRGRYHYAADTVAGVAWAGVVCVATGS